MANLNEQFKTFSKEITLTEARRKSLKTSRKELRTKVREWFKENKPEEPRPKFNGQGSMAVDTIINPIPRKVTVDGEEKTKLYYDIDDGIYFEGSKHADERASPSDYHKWVYEAVKGHTSTDPIDKNSCIRTIFWDGKNIDQPIYYKRDNIPELAHKKDGWIQSDPKAFSDWFLAKVDLQPQLRSLVRYMKAWADLREYSNEGKSMPSGLILTILVAENAVYRSDRDDIALKETLITIQSKLQNDFACYRPTVPIGENLLEGYPSKDYFMKCLQDFIDDAKKALQEKNYKKASECWRSHLSDRFPLGEDKDETSNSSLGLGTIIPATTKPYAE